MLNKMREELAWLPETMTREDAIELLIQYSTVVSAITVGMGFQTMAQCVLGAKAADVPAADALAALVGTSEEVLAEIKTEVERVAADHVAWIAERKAALEAAKAL
jgi:hypothetical protein